MTRYSAVLRLAVVEIVWIWNPSVKPVRLICATLKTKLTLSSAKPSPSFPDSVSMQVANHSNGGMQLFAVRAHLNVWPCITGISCTVYCASCFAELFDCHWNSNIQIVCFHRQEMSVQHGVLGVCQYMS